MMKNTILSTVNVCKTYGTGSEQHHAIKNLNLEIYENDFTIIMGSSGSGKSTLLYLLSGLDNITAGEVYYQGQRIDDYTEGQMADFRTNKISFVYQAINLIPEFTIYENIVFPGYLTGKRKSDVQKRAHEVMTSMNIGHLKNRLPSQVSGGQQQRAAIGRALINNPEVIFADEPTGSLNEELGNSILDILTEMNRNKQTVVMVTHDIKAATRADRLILIKDGEVDGIMEFDKYQKEDGKSRENTIYSYLSRKGV